MTGREALVAEVKKAHLRTRVERTAAAHTHFLQCLHTLERFDRNAAKTNGHLTTGRPGPPADREPAGLVRLAAQT